MPSDTLEMGAVTATDGPHFTGFQVDRRTRFSRLAEHILTAFYLDLGGLDTRTGVPADLKLSEIMAVEDAALAVARARQLQERAAGGETIPPSDIAAATHLALKGRSLVSRIAKRTAAKRRLAT